MQTSSQQNQAYKQENRQDAFDDAYDDYGPRWGGSYYNYAGGALAAATVIAVGTAVTVGTMEAMTTPTATQPAACTAYVNGEMSYVAVAAPPGF